MALRAITIDPAKTYRVDHRLGSLKEGKAADLVICDGKLLEISTSVWITVINGEVVWEPKGKADSRECAEVLRKRRD